MELFKERREKLNASISEVKEQRSRDSVALEKLESNDACQSNLIPRTEELLESYDSMTNQERNDLLKAILQKIEYQKGADGTIEIDLYPRLPHL